MGKEPGHFRVSTVDLIMTKGNRHEFAVEKQIDDEISGQVDGTKYLELIVLCFDGRSVQLDAEATGTLEGDVFYCQDACGTACSWIDRAAHVGRVRRAGPLQGPRPAERATIGHVRPDRR